MRWLSIDVPCRLPRSAGTHAPRPRGRGRPHDDLPMDPEPTWPELEKRTRPHLRMSNGSWRVDETYVRVKGRWTYLYRAVDSRGRDDRFPSGCAARNCGRGQAVLSARPSRDRIIAYPRTAHRRQESCLSHSGREHEKRRSKLSRRTCLRQCKYLNNIVEQTTTTRRIKRRTPRPELGFGRLQQYRAANFGGFQKRWR